MLVNEEKDGPELGDNGPLRRRRGTLRPPFGAGRAQREQRREAILRAASTLFSRNGYHATSVADVIAAAGISRGTFYLYFDNKDSLFLELIERSSSGSWRSSRWSTPTMPNPTARIYDNVRRVVDVVFDNQDLTVMVLREARSGFNPEVDEKLKRFYGFVREMVEGALENGARLGLIRKVNEPIVATALIGAIKEVFLHHLVIAPRERAAARVGGGVAARLRACAASCWCRPPRTST